MDGRTDGRREGGREGGRVGRTDGRTDGWMEGRIILTSIHFNSGQNVTRTPLETSCENTSAAVVLNR